jgi:hypothetical protein
MNSALLSAHYWMIRPLQMHRYFPVSWVPLIGFRLASPEEFPCSISKPGPGSRHLYTGHHTTKRQVFVVLILGILFVPSFDVASGVSMRNQWFTCIRLPNPYMTSLIPPFDRIVHHLTVTGSAAYGCLKPTPVGRLRRAYLHLRHSIVFRTSNTFMAHNRTST